MRKYSLHLAAAGITALAAATIPAMAQNPEGQHVNPFLTPYDTPFEIPPFDRILTSDYLPAFTAGIEQARADIDAIAGNPETPTFENTIVAMDMAGDILDRVSRVFYALVEADSSEELQAIDEQVGPMLSRHRSEVMMNPALFARVKALHDARDTAGYTEAQRRAIEESYRNFVRSGALLSDADKQRLTDVNMRLADLYIKFNKNLLAAMNDFAVFVDDPARLSGIPANVVAVAAEEAAARGKEGQWAFTLHAPSRLPVLQGADDRDLRRDIYRGYTSMASKAPYDNRPVINDILVARAEKARLLGYPDFASYMTENVMAKNPQNAIDLLMRVWKPTVKKVHEEVAEMQDIMDGEGRDQTIEPWDYYYYAEKVRLKKYNLNEDELRPYFAADSVRRGVFNLAERLYGVTFRPMPDAPKYHPDVNVYEVIDTDGNHVAVFMTDYFSRPSKRQGAWMDEMKSSYVARDGTAVRPIIYNVCNFAKPTASSPSLLTMDDVSTTFHEFGHALHGMLSRAEYKCQSGTAVDRDFVELPSQITEHWATEPELLKVYARHYETGKPVSDELIAKLQAASRHNAGFDMCERVAASYLDLQYGLMANPDGNLDIEAFEQKVVEELGMPREVEYRYHSPYFKHIFGSDGYASGYYTYLWAEVLDTDAFEMFRRNGPFDSATAKAFKEKILERGGSADPMELFVSFRGQEPTVDALLRQHGLADDADANLQIKD